jgi:uncharacterized membrane protein (UPF0127 family)
MDYVITNARTGQMLVERAVLASSPWMRMRGLLGRASMPATEAIILRPASSIHTLFMRFALDVIYLDREDRVVKVVPNLVPYRFSAAKKAHTVLEMTSGATEGKDLQLGDHLLIEPPKP